MQMTQSNESNWQDRIDDYLLGKLSPEENDAFEIYCFGNPEFLKEVQIREEIINVIKEKNEVIPERKWFANNSVDSLNIKFQRQQRG